MAAPRKHIEMAVISDPKDFDTKSGGLLERIIFNNRIALILCCALLTLFLGFQIRHLEISASYDKTLPQSHPYIKNYLENRSELRGLGDSVRVAVEPVDGDIFNAEYLAQLAKINDEIFLLKGVDRPWMQSIFAPVVRWTEVTEEGFNGGPVLPHDYDGSPSSIENLRINIARANVVGSLVANDYRSSMIVIPLMPIDAEGKSVNYKDFSDKLDDIAQRYAGAKDAKVRVYVIGFAKMIGDLIAGLKQVAMFFAIAVIIAAAIIYTYTRCVRSTALVLTCSIVAVIWQLGLISLLGYTLDPFSMLVPFLVVAIG
ncbi:MAG: RND family transporter, partial [Azonexus sp.]|nr:RND family transporter [Azonexus sp.]